ncbi:tRNA (uracil-5-)-methyltransferase related enzyme [Metamycoplasma arthritidis]|uniref:tRNA (Uracil-5-)-methyltransferase related enzyme n=1 Tax=Metamycoplasma arthritidis (strain 158L3-1) TaxID=243272 RepID=B3PNA0_META1|nr:23S rRNA (uracil(1939)-C(5))-methyltransferase RlmD [Metamycoplasma arthritidis]ACF07502.1 tRNA (uracil-5-)-methyltransferase related enzyme [Metamycoplasma arthritidis 158L3-1]VEU79024.1 tRNA (uracil-5-)-methyltransferase related enzyme [Metamycoplasma arthritidis]
MEQYKINQILKAQKATEFSYEGYGVIRENGYPIFVKNLLIGEVADIQIIKVTAKFAIAEIFNLIETSPKRIPIKNYELFRSCAAPLMILSYEDQLAFKQKIVNDLFLRELNFRNVKEITPSPLEINYRNKLRVHVECQGTTFKMGFYVKNSHILVEQTSYDLAYKEIGNILEEIDFLCKKEVLLEDNFIKKNKITSITVKYSEKTGESQVIFESLKQAPFPASFIKRLIEKFDNLNIVQIVCNEEKTKILKLIVLAGKESIEYKIDKLKFNVSSQSFYQVNEKQTNKMYKTLLKSLNLTGSEFIVDAFAGVGTIGMYLAKKAKQVVCVEISKKATLNGKENAKLNSLNNLEFISEDCNRFFDKECTRRQNIDVIVFDPPREGLNKTTINAIIPKSLKRIAYISCNPRTLVRDLKLFTSKGYKIEFVQPFDMFPQTYHVETLALLSKSEV